MLCIALPSPHPHEAAGSSTGCRARGQRTERSQRADMLLRAIEQQEHDRMSFERTCEVV
jgi:hypothetical protein